MYKVLISDCVSVWKETPWSIPALKIKPLHSFIILNQAEKIPVVRPSSQIKFWE